MTLDGFTKSKAVKIRCACGSTSFWRNYRTGGTWRTLVESTESGLEVIDTDLDSVRNIKEPKTIQCTECKKRFPNPDA